VTIVRDGQPRDVSLTVEERHDCRQISPIDQRGD